MRHETQLDGWAGHCCFQIEADGREKVATGLNCLAPISIMQRELHPLVAIGFERLDLSRLPELRLSGTREVLGREIAGSLSKAPCLPALFADWLTQDIDALIRLFGEVTGCAESLVRLGVVRDDACSRFHTDNVRYRLVTTYRGPGTQWISPKHADLLQDGSQASPDIVRQLGTGWVALIRGRKDADATTPAILHRSPSVRTTGITRLFLSIDDLSDHHLPVADNLSTNRLASEAVPNAETY